MITILLEKIKALLIELKTNIENIHFDNSYSLNEKKIGLWVDGSDLYSKTYIVNLTNELTQTIAELPDNINVKEMSGMLDNSPSGVFLPINWNDSNSSYLRVVISGYKLQTIKRFPGDWEGRPVNITLKYTKTLLNEED